MNEVDTTVSPTDSRRRPDQRLMEDGDFDNANVTKIQLEERQVGGLVSLAQLYVFTVENFLLPLFFLFTE